jgi:cytochrome c
MLDGSRRFAVLLAIILLLSPTATLAGGSKASAPKTKKAKVAITPQARAAAADIFESRCVACHGTEGRGDGPAAGNLKPKPMNFHNSRWQKSIDDATIARAIVFGGQAVGVSAEMAPNPDLEQEPAIVAALVERVRELCK